MATGRFILRTLVDLAGLAAPLKGAPQRQHTGPGKRILIFNWRDKRHRLAGGAEAYTHELAKRLVRDGNLVTLFCGHDGTTATPRHETIDGVHIVRRGGFWFVYLWAFVYYIFRFRRRYDIIIDCHNGIPFFAPLFAREPVICIVHHVHQEIFKKHLAKPLALFAGFLERRLMPRAYNRSHYVAVSPSTKAEMQDVLGIKNSIDIIYNGVDLERLVPGQKSPTPLILFLGRLQTYKSVDVLIKAFRAVHRATPNARLVIAGSGEAETQLKQLVTAEGLEACTEFTGRVSDERRLELMQQAWVAVNPSFMEGWGLTTIEANACGTPVIGSDVAGLRDSIKDGVTGFLVPYGKVKALADEILKLIGDRSVRTQVSRSAHDWAQRFHWDTSTEQLEQLIAERASAPLPKTAPITSTGE